MSRFNVPQTDVSFDDPVAVVGFAKNIEIPGHEAAGSESAMHFHIQTIRACLRDAGVPMARLRQRNAATVIGFNHKTDADEAPIMVAPRVSKELGLAQPGMTVEFGEVSGMVALHFAKADIVNGKHGFAVVAELVENCAGPATMNVVLLQLLSEAMQDGHQVHGLIKGTALGFQDHAESLLAECCEKAQIARGQVLKIESRDGAGLANVLTWIAMGEAEPAEADNDLDTAGFTTFASSSSTQVTLLLQAPLVSQGVSDEDAGEVSFENLAMAEGAFCEFFEGSAFGAPSPWPNQASVESGIGRYGLGPRPGFSLLGLQWHDKGDMPMFMSCQQGEI